MSLIASHVLIGLPDHQRGGVAPSHTASLSMSADGWSSWTLESREGRTNVAAGELVRWRDERGPDSLGIVLYPTTDELAFVLVVDNSGNCDVEAFSARPHDTGVTAPAMVLEMMEVVLNPDPQLVRPLLEQLPEIQAELSSPG